MKKLAPFILFIVPFFAYACLWDMLGGGSGTITQLDFWKNSGTSITPRNNKPIIVSGLTVNGNATTTSLVTGTISVPNYINFTGSSNTGNVFVGNKAGLYIKDFAGITLSTFVGNNAGTGSSTALTSAADGNTGVGTNALKSLTSGSYNTAVGHNGLSKVTSGNGNIAIGRSTAQYLESGSYNIAIGSFTTLGNLVSGLHNLALGYGAGYKTIGSNGIYLGSYAGYYETEGSTFYINNRNLTDTAGDKAYSLLYGTFGTGASTVGQTLTVNGRLAVGTSTPQRQFVVTSGATATTTIQFADVYSGTGKTCFEVGQTDGSIASFYFVGGAMIIETNACVE